MPYSDKPQQILKEIATQQNPYPIYVLMGDEPFYTDKIEEALVRTFLPNEEQHDFNLSILYGHDSSVQQVLAACMRPPMGSPYTLTVVREAQDLFLSSRGSKKEGQSPFDAVMTLLKHPSPFNIIILCFKGKSPSRTLKVMKEIEKVGLVVHSPIIPEWHIQDYIPSIAQLHGLKLSYDAVKAVMEHLGNDIGRMSSEFEKLSTALSEKQKQAVTADLILRYTSLDKEYTAFDLKNALAVKNKARAFSVARSLAKDSKRVPVQVIIPVLFNYFANLLIAHYAGSTNPNVLKEVLEIKSTKIANDFIQGLKYYKPSKIAKIITYLRRMDARSKGMYSEEGNPEEILTDLVLMILN